MISREDDLERCSLVSIVVDSPQEIPQQYADYTNIFLEKGAAALSRDAHIEYCIEIKEGK